MTSRSPQHVLASLAAGVAFGICAVIAFGSISQPAKAGPPWNGNGHCQFGAVYGPPLPTISMTESGHVNRQCNSTGTASHGSASGSFTVYRTTGSANYHCNASGSKCGYRWYLDNNGWIHCAWTTGLC
jgi:hypothetical protein